MVTELKKAIKRLASEAARADNPIGAQQYAQAVLNLANALLAVKKS